MDLFSSYLFKSADENARVFSLEAQWISLLIWERQLREFDGLTLPYIFTCKSTRIQINVSPNKKKPETYDHKIRHRTVAVLSLIILYKLPKFLSWVANSGGTYFQNYNSIRELKETLADQKDFSVTAGTSRVGQLQSDANWIWFKLMEYSDMCQSPSKLE